jgi:hypothetical protein
MAIEQLEALGGMVDEMEAANPSQEHQQAQAEQAAAEAQADQGARQFGMLMFTIGGFAQMIAPELKPVYSEERCYQWGQQAQAVADKYGWSGPSAMPELALIASTAGFAVPTYLVLRSKIEQAKAVREGTLVEKLAAWWQHRKAQRAQRQAEAEAARSDVVAEMRPQEGEGNGRPS